MILLPLRKYKLLDMGAYTCKFLVLGRLRKDDCPFRGSWNYAFERLSQK